MLASVLDSGRGRAALTNLYGPAKAEAAAALIDRHHDAAVHVYTDHAHDLPLMHLADEVTLVHPGPATVKVVKESGIDAAILR